MHGGLYNPPEGVPREEQDSAEEWMSWVIWEDDEDKEEKTEPTEPEEG
jgi:hypothetical protein